MIANVEKRELTDVEDDVLRKAIKIALTLCDDESLSDYIRQSAAATISKIDGILHGFHNAANGLADPDEDDEDDVDLGSSDSDSVAF